MTKLKKRVKMKLEEGRSERMKQMVGIFGIIFFGICILIMIALLFR